MRRFILCFFFIPLILIILSYCTKQNDFPVLKGPYLGQKPPGMTPEVFAKGIISNDEIQGCYVFMNMGKIFIFNSMIKNDDWQISPTYIMEYKSNKWTIPEKVPFQELYPYNFSGGVSSDGKTLYFSSLRLPDGSGKLGDANIWMIHKTSGGSWSEPENLGEEVNSPDYEVRPSITSDSQYFFFTRGSLNPERSDIYWVDSKIIEKFKPKERGDN